MPSQEGLRGSVKVMRLGIWRIFKSLGGKDSLEARGVGGILVLGIPSFDCAQESRCAQTNDTREGGEEEN